jgi:RNA recognition motif-containing protein
LLVCRGYGPGPSGGYFGGDPGNEALGVFLRGIPSSTTRDELREKFGGYGNVVSVVIVPSKTHETYTAYVDFDSEAAASKVSRVHSNEGTPCFESIAAWPGWRIH